MTAFIYLTVWFLFIIVAIIDITTVSSFDLMEICSQKHLRTNITISPIQSRYNAIQKPPTLYPTHYLRHANIVD